MKYFLILAMAVFTLALISCKREPASKVQIYYGKGIVERLNADGKMAVIKHEAISNYMEAMTMPFNVNPPSELAGITPGDEITFRLLVNDEASWIDQLAKTGKTYPVAAKPAPETLPASKPTFSLTNIPDFDLTNEFNQRVSLRDIKGKAVALTFFFTRCPLPEYCPRLSKNFEGASQKLAAMSNGPTNFQLFSISFDPLDHPDVLRAYGKQYHYDSNHWSFLTGNSNHIHELARGFGVGITNDGFSYVHDFATAVFDSSGRLQNLWRFGGDTTEIIATEILKATASKQ